MKKTLFTIFLGSVLGTGIFWVVHQETAVPQGAFIGASFEDIVEDAQAFLLPPVQTTYLPIRDFDVPEPIINARSALLVDARSHRVLFAKNPDEKFPIASITKLMTAIVVLDSMQINEVYMVRAEDMNLDGNGADFMEGERLRGTELMKIMLLKSSNDAASVFATHAYLEGVDFVALMNQKAETLGMASTRFTDPAGLNDQDAYSTASDVALLIRAAMEYEFIRDVTVTSRIDVPTIGGAMYHIINTNQLLDLIPRIILGKTGNTLGALGTMALAVNIDEDDSLISVVLGSDDRFGETKKLVDWGKKAHQWN